MKKIEIINEVKNAHLNYIIVKLDKEKQLYLEKQNLLQQNLLKAYEKNDLTLQSYLKKELSLIEQKIQTYNLINENTTNILIDIISKISPYLYQDVSPDYHTLFDKAVLAYSCGDNVTLTEILNSIKNENLTYYDDIKTYQMYLLILKDINNR